MWGRLTAESSQLAGGNTNGEEMVGFCWQPEVNSCSVEFVVKWRRLTQWPLKSIGSFQLASVSLCSKQGEDRGNKKTE